MRGECLTVEYSKAIKRMTVSAASDGPHLGREARSEITTAIQKVTMSAASDGHTLGREAIENGGGGSGDGNRQLEWPLDDPGSTCHPPLEWLRWQWWWQRGAPEPCPGRDAVRRWSWPRWQW